MSAPLSEATGARLRVTIVNRLAGVFWGGGETFDLETARALRGLGHEVSFVVGRRLRRLDVPMTEFPVTYVPTPYLRWIAYRGETSRSRLVRAASSWALPLDLDLFERAALRAITGSDLARKTDVFQLCSLPRLGAWLREHTGRPSIVVWHGPPGPRLRSWNERCSGTFSFGGALEAVRRNVDPRAVEIPPGVDTERFTPEDTESPADASGPSGDRLRSRYGIAQDAVVFAFFDRMIPIKNLPFLLESFRSAAAGDPRPALALFGDGPLRGRILELAESWGLSARVVAPGRIEREDLGQHYRMSDALVVSSTFETYPMVVMEAAACALPVVATRVGGIPGMVRDGKDGLLVESGDVAGMAAALLRLTRSPEERRRMGRMGREKALAEYSWQKTAERMLALYAQVGGEA